MSFNNLDINEIRKQFPILSRTVYGKPLVYFDNAATTQKPLCVIERERDYYLNENCKFINFNNLFCRFDCCLGSFQDEK